MGYYMRFITTEKKPSSIGELNALLQTRKANWNLEIEEASKRPSADIKFGEHLLGELELNQPGDGLFDEEIEELLEFIEEDCKGDRSRVENLLRNATAAYVVRVLSQGRESGETLEYLDVFWEVLFQRHDGLLQADAEGYYDDSGIVLEVG